MESRLYFIIAFGIIFDTIITAIDGKKTFNYTINNQLEEPFFAETMEMSIVNKKPLIYYMEKSVLQDPERFTRSEQVYSSG